MIFWLIPNSSSHYFISPLEVVMASSPPADTFTMTLGDLVEKEEVKDVRLDRIATVHRAVAIATDAKGHNYSVLQCHPSAW